MYLGASGCVLGSSAGDELCIMVINQVVVETHMFLLGKDGVVGLETVLLEHGIIAEWYISLSYHIGVSRLA